MRFSHLIGPNGTPAAIVGAVFYGLASLQHLRNTERTRLANIALASNLFIATIAVLYVIAA
ncbi:hypothetical protein J4G37_08630 [Microvirga sp. 3-52]|nr:hypothetical protein [Microvirga sp. 3-52]